MHMQFSSWSKELSRGQLHIDLLFIKRLRVITSSGNFSAKTQKEHSWALPDLIRF